MTIQPENAALDSDGISSIGDVPIEQKAMLLTGRNFWETEPLDVAGIRSIWLADGPHGLRHQSGQQDNLAVFDSDPATCFPPAVAVGSSWDPALAARVGSAVGKEAVAQGVDIVLGPGVNIKRSPLCGRNFEYYSEDPHLAGALGTAFTKGLQDEGPGVSVKHFAANNQETNRQTISANVDERTLREIYLPAFEQVVTEAQPATVMTSYNKINGTSTWANRWLLTTLLREEWGFTGAVISDWSSVTDRVAAAAAGLDLEMPGERQSAQEIISAVESGVLDESIVNASVQRLAAMASRPRREPSVIDVEAQHVTAQEIAAECVVLLRNEHKVLPIPDDVRIAVIGAFAESPRYQGGGSAHVNATRVDKPLDEIRSAAESLGSTVTFSPGFRLDGTPDDSLVAEAVDAARRADIAVIFAGLTEERESEGFDRDTLDLPEDQIALIREVADVAHRVVVVLANGGIVSLEGWHDQTDAIVEGFVLGQGGGRAIADILFGHVNPSGRLAESIPLRLEDHPSWLNFPGEQGHVNYGEGVLVGYRYFATSGAPVRYPFGHGLSYSTFITGEADVTMTGPDSVTVRVPVTNRSERAGKHVVQVYVATQAGPVRRPARELRGFRKIHLQPGESTTVEIDLPRRAFTYWDTTAKDWVVAAGLHSIQVCADSNTVLHSTSVALEGDNVAGELTLESPVGTWFDHPGVGPETLNALGFTGVSIPEEQLAMVRSMTMRQFVRISGLAVAEETLANLMAASRR